MGAIGGLHFLTTPALTFHYERTNHDENMNEPILERRMMGKHVNLEYFQKVAIYWAQIPKFLQISPNFIIFEGFFINSRSLDQSNSSRLKLFLFHMFTPSSYFPKWAHSYFHHD